MLIFEHLRQCLKAGLRPGSSENFTESLSDFDEERERKWQNKRSETPKNGVFRS